MNDNPIVATLQILLPILGIIGIAYAIRSFWRMINRK